MPGGSLSHEVAVHGADWGLRESLEDVPSARPGSHSRTRVDRITLPALVHLHSPQELIPTLKMNAPFRSPGS